MLLRQNPVERKVVELLEEHLEHQGYELVLVEYRKGARSSLLRLLVDRKDGRVGLADLERLTPTVSDLLDVYDPVEGRYTLEVASPGINRPLSKRGHFESHLGRRVKIRTHQPLEGRKVFIGVLAAVNQEGVEIQEEEIGRRQTIAFDAMKTANYEHNFDQENGARNGRKRAGRRPA